MQVSLDMRSRSLLIVSGVSYALLCLAGCGAPGKPGPPEVAPRDQMNFSTLFGEHCQACHGVDGRGGAGRILNDPLYLAVLPRQDLHNVIENGRPGTAMPAWSERNGGPLSQKQINSLVDGIENNWAKPAEFRGVQLPSYYQPKNGGDVSAGQKTFVRDCYMCHGPGAVVGSVTDAAFLSLITNQCLRTSVIVGRPDLGMPDYRHLNLGRALSDEDITNLVAYLSAKRSPEVTATLESAQASMSPPFSGEEAGATGMHENGARQSGPTARGNEGSGTGSGSPQQRKQGSIGAPSSGGDSHER